MIHMKALQENLGYQASALYSLASQGKITFQTAAAGLEALIEVADLNRNVIAKHGSDIEPSESAKITLEESEVIYRLCQRLSTGKA